MSQKAPCGLILLLLAFATVGKSARAITLTHPLTHTTLVMPGGCRIPGPLVDARGIAVLSQAASHIESTILDPRALPRESPAYTSAHALTKGGQFFTTVAPAAVGVAYEVTHSETLAGTQAPSSTEFLSFNSAQLFYFDANPATIDWLRTSSDGMRGPFAEIVSLDEKLLLDSPLIDSMDAIAIQLSAATTSPVFATGRELTYLSDSLPSALDPVLATGAVARVWNKLDLAILADSGNATSSVSSARTLIVWLVFTLSAVALIVLSSAHQEAPQRLSPFVFVRLTIGNTIGRKGSLRLLPLECYQQLLRTRLRLRLAGPLSVAARMPCANPQFIAFDFVAADYRLILSICRKRAGR